MSGGLRILCLDGGGTRGLSSIYLLQEIMNRISPGQGGSIRPAEYFDMIGACGPNGLLALLFSKFSFTIDEALEFFHDFSRRMDAAETILENRAGEELDDEDFDEDPDPDVVIETVRRQVVCNTFRDVVLERITDWLEQSEHKDGNDFSYKFPLAVVGVGRCRVAIMGSESPGHGPNKGVVKHRVYHAPLWHKSYTGRHTRPTYTWWAIGLGTMGSPGIVSNGVIFPDFGATGAHSDHNPVQLLLQECSRIWPGLKAKLIISIGTGNLKLPDLWNLTEHPHSLVAAEACLEMCEENQRKAKDLEKYVLPHDEVFRSAYFRFDVPSELPFFEFEAKDTILTRSMEYMQTSEVASRATRAVSMLQEETVPDTREDHVALSALASLAATFLAHGYPDEAELVSDTISSYMLYEHTIRGTGFYRKSGMAAQASKLSLYVTHQIRWGERTTANPISIPFYLTSVMAYGKFEDPNVNVGELGVSTMVKNSDFAAACHYLITCQHYPRRSPSQEAMFASIQDKLALEIGMPSELTPSFISGVETLLRMSSLATLCEIAYKEVLSNEPRLILNPNFLRHFNQTILQQDLSNFSNRILDPIATVISTLLHIGNWSTYRDPLITKLLTVALNRPNDSWSFANLAVERIEFFLKEKFYGEVSECLKLCHRFTEEQNAAFQRSAEAKILSAEKGYLGLLRNVLEGDRDLDAIPRAYSATPCAWAGHALDNLVDGDGNNLLHITARNGFLMAHKMIVELLGTVKGKPPLAALNNEGLAPIHIACKSRGHRNILMLCLYGGGDINQRDAFGRTALHYCFPEQDQIHEYLPALEEFIQKHDLLLTLPVQAACVFGTMYNHGKIIDNRTHMLRTLIRRLYCRGGSINIQDEQGLTPAHLAAKNGWGINSDLFFIGIGARVEEESAECLGLTDKSGNTVLALMRMNGDVEGERIITSEMRNRMMDTSVGRNPQRGRTIYPLPQNTAASIPGGVSAHRPTTSTSSDNTPQQNSNTLQYQIPLHWRQDPSAPTYTPPRQSHSPLPPEPIISPQETFLPSTRNTIPTYTPLLPPNPPISSPSQSSHQTTSQPSPSSTHTSYTSTPHPHHQNPPSPAFPFHPPNSSPHQQPSHSPDHNPNIYRPPTSPAHPQQHGQSSSMNPNIYHQEQSQHSPGSPPGRKENVGNKLFNKLKKRL